MLSSLRQFCGPPFWGNFVNHIYCSYWELSQPVLKRWFIIQGDCSHSDKSPTTAESFLAVENVILQGSLFLYYSCLSKFSIYFTLRMWMPVFSFKQRYWNCVIMWLEHVCDFFPQQHCAIHYTRIQSLHSKPVSSRRHIGHWKPFSLKRQEWIANNLWPGEKKSLNLLLSCKLLFVEHDGHSCRMLNMLSWKTLGIWLENISILSQDFAELNQVSLWLKIKIFFFFASGGSHKKLLWA